MDLLKEIKEIVSTSLPEEARVTSVDLEGPEVAVYTKNPKAFFENENFVAKLAFDLKKRVNIRTDKSLLIPEEEAKKKIEEILPADAGVKDIQFNPAFSEVVIEAIKPGLVIGKGGETSKKIILETGWTPNILRAPTTPSEILKGIRHHLHKYSAERKKILQETAKKIYEERDGKSNGWIRMTALGGYREVGRSCMLVETRDTKIIMDCGINVANSDEPYPYLDAIRFPINELDAIIISHAHLDHSGFTPYLFKLGYRGPVYCTAPTRDLMALLQFDYIDVLLKEGKEPPYSERDVKEMVKYCITREYREVTDIAPDMRLTFHNAAHILGSASVHLHMGEGAHNLVYSLDHKVPVTIIDKHNNVHTEEIGKLVDREIKKFGVSDGYVDEAANLSGWKTIAFNPLTLKAEKVEITSFVRHPINEDLFEIKTKSGRKTIVTGSHSVFTVKDGIVTDIMAKDLTLGDYIVGLRRLNIKAEKPIISLPQNKFAVKLNGEKLETRLNETYEKIKKRFPDMENKLMCWAREHLENGLYENAIAKKYNASRKTVRKYFKELGIQKNLRRGTLFASQIEIKKDFARFLGYFVSEGSTNKNTVIITQYDKKMLEDSIRIIECNFGIKGKIVRNEAQFYSKQLALLLKEVLACGNNAHAKRAPRQIMLAEEDVIAEFLKGCFLGDGCFIKKPKGMYVNCTSKSKFLIQEIGFLLLRIGIAATFTYNKSIRMHNLNIYGQEQLDRFFKFISIEKWENKYRAHKYAYKKSCFADRIPISALSQQTQETFNLSSYRAAKSCSTAMLLRSSQNTLEKKLVESDLLFDEINSIRKVRSSSKYVYDFSVTGYENFLGGSGHLFMHNTGDFKYGFTRLFNNIDMQYPRLETLIIESTYGSRDDIMPQRQEAEEILLEVIREATERGGNVLIPVFAVGRAQEIMLVIENFYRRGLIDAKVFVDGMTREASAIHTAYPEYLREIVQRRVLTNDSPFTSDAFQVIDPQNRDAVLNEKKAIIISSSGMLTGGPAVYYFNKMAEDPLNTLIFVGYQGEGSQGRKIQSGLRSMPVNVNGKTRELHIKMQVETVEGFSGHSDFMQLANYVRNLKPKPKKVIVDHGDQSKTVEFAKFLANKFKLNCTAPRDLDSLRLK
ncbi:MAG: LAGLIDADG family homing endonuclease [Candidatus Diapherotrites archaeon]